METRHRPSVDSDLTPAATLRLSWWQFRPGNHLARGLNRISELLQNFQQLTHGSFDSFIFGCFHELRSPALATQSLCHQREQLRGTGEFFEDQHVGAIG